jgi:hypothetical protein
MLYPFGAEELSLEIAMSLPIRANVHRSVAYPCTSAPALSTVASLSFSAAAAIAAQPPVHLSIWCPPERAKGGDWASDCRCVLLRRPGSGAMLGLTFPPSLLGRADEVIE